MKTYFGGLSLLVLAMTLSPVTVSAEVPTPAAQGDFDGRHYEIIAANNISWTTANAAAGVQQRIRVSMDTSRRLPQRPKTCSLNRCG